MSNKNQKYGSINDTVKIIRTTFKNNQKIRDMGYRCYRSITKPLKSQIQHKIETKHSKKSVRWDKKSRSLGLIPPLFSTKHYYLTKGNNHTLVGSILQNNEYDITSKIQQASLLWLQDNKKFEYSSKKNNVLVNMFQFHTEITNKDKLYNNLKVICGERGLDVNEITPVTFVIDTQSQYLKVMLAEFLRYYVGNHPNKGFASKLKGSFGISQGNNAVKVKYREIVPSVTDSKELKSTSSVKHSKQINLNHDQFEPQQCLNHTKQLQNSPKPEQMYVWILKPSNLNRGRNVKLFSKLKHLQQLLNVSDPLAPFRMYTDHQKQPQSRYVIQKYIDRPLLIMGRKFDIRVWALIDPNLSCYFFNQGYLRLSGYEYSMGKQSLDNNYVHLTNNAIQKNSQSYGKYEQGNQLSFSSFKEYLEQNTQIEYSSIISRMKALVKLSLEATLGLINQKNRKGCFQLLGYDFLIDQSGHVWLIECNSNPCLQQSSDLLSRLLGILLKETMNIVHKRKTKQEYFQQLI